MKMHKHTNINDANAMIAYLSKFIRLSYYSRSAFSSGVRFSPAMAKFTSSIGDSLSYLGAFGCPD